MVFMYRYIYLGLSPPPRMPVTTQDDITFLVGDPELNLYWPQLLGGGDNPKYTSPMDSLGNIKDASWWLNHPIEKY